MSVTIQPCSTILDPLIRFEFQKLYDYLNQLGDHPNMAPTVPVPPPDGPVLPGWEDEEDEEEEGSEDKDLVADPQAHQVWHQDFFARPVDRFRDVGTANVLGKIIGVDDSVYEDGGGYYNLKRCDSFGTTTWGEVISAYDSMSLKPVEDDIVMVSWVRNPTTDMVEVFFQGNGGPYLLCKVLLPLPEPPDSYFNVRRTDTTGADDWGATIEAYDVTGLSPSDDDLVVVGYVNQPDIPGPPSGRPPAPFLLPLGDGGGGGPDPYDAAPEDIQLGDGPTEEGESNQYARGDHTHRPPAQTSGDEGKGMFVDDAGLWVVDYLRANPGGA